MSSESVTDSGVNLVSSSTGYHSSSSEPQVKKFRFENGSNNVNQDQKKKSRIFGKFKIGKSRKIRDHNEDLNEVPVKTRKIGTTVTPTSNGLSITRDPAEMKPTRNLSENEKHHPPSSFKSFFGKKENELDVNRSGTTKLFYFGLLLPAMALHPESLKEVKFLFNLLSSNLH